MNRKAVSLALALGTVNAACLNFRPSPRPLPAALAGSAPDTVWTAKAGRGFSGPFAFDDSTAYGGGVDRKVYAIDLRTGATRWSVRLGGMVLGGVRRSGDTLYAASARPTGRVHALSRRRKGKQLWRTRTGEVGAPLTVTTDAVIALTLRGQALSLDRRTGKVRWRREVGVARSAAADVGRAGLVVATTDSVLRLDRATGKVLRRVRSPGTVLGSWLRWRGLLVAGTSDSQVVALRLPDLGVAWRARLDAPVLETPVVRHDSLFAATRIGSVYLIPLGARADAPEPTRLAALRWPLTAPVVLTGDEMLLGGADGTIRSLGFDGRERWRIQVWRPVETAPAPLPDGLLAVGGNGDLHRYRR